MKESLWGYYLVLLGITVSTIMIMVTNMTTTSQQDYYLLKEITNAAMIDAIDYSYYTAYGKVKITTEKFVENFIRRFSESISKTNTYKIDFYSIYENPPSVSIKVTSNTGEYHIAGDEANIDVINNIDAILEANNIITTSKIFYSIPYGSCEESNYISKTGEDAGYCSIANRAMLNLDEYAGEGSDSSIYSSIQKKLDGKPVDSNNIKISDVEFLSIMSDKSDLDKYREQFNATYKRAPSFDDIPDSIRDPKYFAKDIKDVRISVKMEKDASGKINYFLGYGLKYKCGVSVYKYYRKGTNLSNVQYITEAQYNALLESSKKEYSKAPFYNSCLIGIKYKVNFYYDES